MDTPIYTIFLTKDEEKVAQLLTRDAWVYFSNLISQRNLFHIKDIPMMPRRGCFELPNDAEMIQYYLDSGHNYYDELKRFGWETEYVEQVVEALANKVEEVTGVRRGMGMVQTGS